MAITKTVSKTVNAKGGSGYANWYKHEMTITLSQQGLTSSTVHVFAKISNNSSSAGWSQFNSPKVNIYYYDYNDVKIYVAQNVTIDQVWPQGTSGSKTVFDGDITVDTTQDPNRIPWVTFYYEFRHNISGSSYQYVSSDCDLEAIFDIDTFDLNVNDPYGVAETGGTINFSFNNGTNWEVVNDEPVYYVPIGQTIKIKDITPATGMVLDNVTNMTVGTGGEYSKVFSGALTVDVNMRWASYTVTFNANGGSVATDSKTVTYNNTYGTLPIPEYEGYTFNGWFTQQTGGTLITDSTYVETANDHTLWAHWKQNETGAFVYLKRGGVWTKGKIYIKLNDEWVLSSDVYVKDNDEWKKGVL